MTSNLNEEIRINIGKMLLIHEFKKLFPSHDTEFIEKIEAYVNQMAQNVSAGNIVGIRDFWNLVSSIMMGYKLKDIASDITSACVDWKLQDVSVGNLKFTAPIIEFEDFDINKKTANEVSKYLSTHPEELEKVKQGTLSNYPDGDTRYSDPIVVLRETDGDFVHDGNGRLMKAILENITSIQGYLGVRNDKTQTDHWVPTSYLFFLKEKIKTNSSVAGLLDEIFSSSQNAKYEWDERVNKD